MFESALTRRRRGETGFTLVELLVVIVILAILAAVVVFAVGGINDKGQTSACDADESSLATAEEAYYANHDPGSYVSEASLVPQYIHKVSPLHDISLGTGTGAGTYTITAVGKCA
jgi:prepilin-type N-terminal cleavage/methylation domain-containing protein